MDPQATLQRILEAQDRAEYREACEDLAAWLRKGGFAPKLPQSHTCRYDEHWMLLWAPQDHDWEGLRAGAAYLIRFDDAGQRMETFELGVEGRK